MSGSKIGARIGILNVLGTHVEVWLFVSELMAFAKLEHTVGHQLQGPFFTHGQLSWIAQHKCKSSSSALFSTVGGCIC